MQITKFANLSPEESKLLVDAGTLLGTLNRAFESAEVDAIADSDIPALIAGIAEVSSKLLRHMPAEQDN